MKSRKAANTPKGEVILHGFDVNNELVAEERISVFDYYEELHAVLDEDVKFRAERGI